MGLGKNLPLRLSPDQNHIRRQRPGGLEEPRSGTETTHAGRSTSEGYVNDRITGSSTAPVDICFEWNSGKKCPRDCKYQHICGNCRGSHTKRLCPTNQNQNPNTAPKLIVSAIQSRDLKAK